jgi:Sulfotransferase domain
LEEFVECMVLARGVPPTSNDSASYWEHLLSWWRKLESREADVLLLFYEDMQADLPGTVDRVAAFLGGDAAGESEAAVALRARTVEHSTFAYMSAPENRGLFDDHIVRAARDPKMGLQWPPKEAGTGKVRASGGQSGQGSGLGPELVAKIDERWKLIADATGAQSYAELRALAKARGYC